MIGRDGVPEEATGDVVVEVSCIWDILRPGDDHQGHQEMWSRSSLILLDKQCVLQKEELEMSS